ncbi:hypothetical protein DICPUDRAFT_47102 [Dictyostelium purpureum]|uniref:Glycoside hydrolase family 5 domain-containing protein n=1 Tax=Dictyostelium purpureum TaxID=5786 RepID=F0ZHU5_DICPU|nr:uncharacterized protein DICPUDRAFT_47102 [Dictyostelium purpureum]EGC36482.1 hypothetical protein DICPUDRAFT_47102 [Dictyostelium purpureum]|eukprot:XP_003286995.1 hypothetical protein DICPUDRAFT_47102 [Dictyostelium purpureum]
MKINYLLIIFIISTTLFNFIYCKEQSTKGLHIKEDLKIYNENDEVIMLRGVNRPGTEYTCVKHQKAFDGLANDRETILIRSWKVNTIRVPLNEDCWLGVHQNEAPWFGEGYRDKIKGYVKMLSDLNMAVIIDLHWSSKNGLLATDQIPMPNAENSAKFWKQVANMFKDFSNVIFDLYNEPYPFGNEWESDEAWACWRDGENCGLDYPTTGLSQLLEAVRSTGAKNIVLLSGIQYATSFTKFLDYYPKDTLSPPQLAASLHAYDFNQCKAKGCWDKFLTPVLNNMPIIATETGQKDCKHDFLDDFLNYCDHKGIHYLAWSWLVGPCDGPSVIVNEAGDPSGFGVGFKKHMDRLAKGKIGMVSDTFDIYNDKLTHWSDNWSSSQPVLNSTEVIACEGNYSIKFVPKKDKSLHFMCWGCIESDLHKQIEFWVHGGSGGNQRIKVELLHLNQDKTNTVEKTWYIDDKCGGPIESNKWNHITLPLDDLPAGQQYDGIWFKAEEDQSPIYVDKITVRAKVEPPADSDDSSKLIFNFFTIVSLIILSLLLI